MRGAFLSNGILGVELTKSNDLYINLKLPSLPIATIGGGTALPAQKQCLDLLGCYGANKAKKFAEIIAATLLAGELNIMGSIANGDFVTAHQQKNNDIKTNL